MSRYAIVRCTRCEDRTIATCANLPAARRTVRRLEPRGLHMIGTDGTDGIVEEWEADVRPIDDYCIYVLEPVDRWATLRLVE
jgi:hypothetical protein